MYSLKYIYKQNENHSRFDSYKLAERQAIINVIENLDEVNPEVYKEEILEALKNKNYISIIEGWFEYTGGNEQLIISEEKDFTDETLDEYTFNTLVEDTIEELEEELNSG